MNKLINFFVEEFDLSYLREYKIFHLFFFLIFILGSWVLVTLIGHLIGFLYKKIKLKFSKQKILEDSENKN